MMNLISIRIITTNVKRLVDFYEQVTGLTAVRYTEDFAEIQSGVATLAIGSTRTLQFFGGDEGTKTAHNHPVIMEFIVQDVDQLYDKMEDLIQTGIVQKPTTMPWGNRSLLFRDPDGNLVNCFTPVSPEALKKFEGRLN